MDDYFHVGHSNPDTTSDFEVASSDEGSGARETDDRVLQIGSPHPAGAQPERSETLSGFRAAFPIDGFAGRGVDHGTLASGLASIRIAEPADDSAPSVAGFDTSGWAYGGAIEPPAPNGTGDLTVVVARSNNQYIDGLIQGRRWSDGSISYSDPDSAADYGGSYSYDNDGNGVSVQNQGFSQLTAQQMLAVHSALNQAIYTQRPGAGGFSVEGFTNLTIDYGGSGTGAATIRAANSTDASGNTAYAFYPSDAITGGDAWFDQSGTNPVLGNYHWHTVLHELGHSLGLKHGQETSNFGAVPADRDSMEFTVMTYRSYIGDPLSGGYSNETWGYAQTYMMLDIAALQYMYGADFTTNSGNSVYKWDPNTGAMTINGISALTPGGNRIFSTIWDGNGDDTYDLSDYATAMSIDLAPGSWSTFSTAQIANLGDGRFARANVFNAMLFNNDQRSLIENVIGGSGGDSITGNDAANNLYGKAGNDILNGGNGDDNLDGGLGADTLNGGAGFDIAFYSQAASGVRVDLSGARAGTGEAAGDTFNLVDGVWGSNFADEIYGDQWSNKLWGAAGADNMYGGGLNDQLYGGAGDDNLDGGTGADYLDGGDGFDIVFYSLASAGVRVDLSGARAGTGDAAGDTFSAIEGVWGSNYADEIYGDQWSNKLYGAGGSDNMFGGALNDQLYGGAGDDFLDGGTGADYLDGGDGFDYVFYSQAASGVVVDLANTVNGTGDANGDYFYYVDGVVGSAFNDTLFGDQWSNVLIGGAGSDRLDGGGGNDGLYGGAGGDYFQFTKYSSGHDTIYDFEDNADLIDLRSWGFASVADALSIVADLGADLRFEFSNGSTLTVKNVDDFRSLNNDLLIYYG